MSALKVRAAVRQQFGGFARAPFYQNMFHAAGFPEVSQGTWSDAMIDAVALWGDESRVAEAIAGLFALGATEILVSPVPQVMTGQHRSSALYGYSRKLPSWGSRRMRRRRASGLTMPSG